MTVTKQEEVTEDNVKSNKSNDNNNEKNTASNSEPTEDQWGYDLYPQRKGDLPKRSIIKMMFGIQGREDADKLKCERNVYSSLKKPLIKLMMGALKNSGCEFDIRRHISCEICYSNVTGGYDPETNQIVVCQNSANSLNKVQGVLTHELVHMFDYCRNDLDFKNIDHLACTEIRAANLAHCSYLSALFQGHASLFHIKETHKDCVKAKALASILTTRPITYEEGQAAIERVFPKCYSDLEPVGRRIRRNSMDMERAYSEAFFYGYT